MSHKITIIDKKTEKEDYFVIESNEDFYNYIKEVFESDLFYIEIEPDHLKLSLKEYKNILRIFSKDFKFPNTIKTTFELEEWINAWKALEEINILSSEE